MASGRVNIQATEMEAAGPLAVGCNRMARPTFKEQLLAGFGLKMKIKNIGATIGSLIALGLLLIRGIRRKKLVSGEVSALRSLGRGRERD